MSRFSHIITLLRGETPPPPVVQEFDGATGYHSDVLKLRMRRPIVLGSAVLLLFVFGLFLWAAISPIYGAVAVPGIVKVEGNSREIRHLEAGIIRQIAVHEGQYVKRGQLLIRFDNAVPFASAQVYQATADTARAQIARYEAEAANASTIAFPADILAREGDPQIAALLNSQRNLFTSQMLLYRSQAQVLQAQMDQLGNQVAGVRAQLKATDDSSDLIQEELNGVRSLNKEGYAPLTRLLALQRNAVALKGQRGQQVTDIARGQQAAGQVRIQLAQLDQKRQGDAADGIRIAQAQLDDAAPKLRAVKESVDQAEMRAPVDGYVFNLTQRSEGGASGAAELLMQIVPADAKLNIEARVPPQNAGHVKVGMPARVTLTSYNPRTTPQIMGKVELVAADATEDQATRQSYYEVRITVPAPELTKAGPNAKLTPGMPVNVAVITGRRTVLQYLLGPLADSMHGALKEQ